MAFDSIAVRAEGVTQRFRLIHERPDTVRELVARFFQSKVSYSDFEAVSNVSFEVERGEMLADRHRRDVERGGEIVHRTPAPALEKGEEPALGGARRRRAAGRNEIHGVGVCAHNRRRPPPPSG